jgi:hypothetical protein
VIAARGRRGLLCSSLAVILAVGVAWPSAVPAAEPVAGAADVDEARRLYDDGRARFDTLDYAGAIELWTKAYALLPEGEQTRAVRNDLVYNIATAQEKAYELDGDPTHLRQARGLLDRYLTAFTEMYEPTPETRAEVEKVNARIAELDAKLAEAGAATEPVPTPGPVMDPAARAREDARWRQQEIKRLLREDPELSRQYRGGTGMVAGGSVALGLGGVSGMVALMFLLARATEEAIDPVTGEETEPERSRATVGAIVSGVLAAGLVTGGAVLLGVGVGRRRRAKRAARERVALRPWGLAFGV